MQLGWKTRDGEGRGDAGYEGLGWSGWPSHPLGDSPGDPSVALAEPSLSSLATALREGAFAETRGCSRKNHPEPATGQHPSFPDCSPSYPSPANSK